MSEYACRALLELSRNYGKEQLLKIKDIAKNQNIPVPYLIQILQELKRIGLVSSRRGSEGGYELTRSPGKITFGEVIRAIDGPLVPLVCLNTETDSVCIVEINCRFKQIWSRVDRAIGDVVDNITFEEICRN